MLYILLLFIITIVKLYLNFRQKSVILKNINDVPFAFREKISLLDHQKAANYSITKLKLDNIKIIMQTFMILAFTFGGLLNYYNSITNNLNITNSYITGGIIISLFILTEFIINTIFDYYSTFKIETKFGFNKSSITTFIIDHIKFLIGSVIIYLPFLSIIVWFLNLDLTYDWLLIWLFYSLFTFLMMLIYPIFIAPLFNKFTLLTDESLTIKINNLLNKCNFKSNGIYVMDGSKRSSHGNAYFTGLGKSKRIVFFDTLINNLLPDEIEAILAHELGHFKKNHIKKQISFILLLAVIFLYGFSLIVKSNSLYQIFNIQNINFYNGILLLMLISEPLIFQFKPLFSYFSRKNEFEADDFAKQYSNKDSLINGLVKLFKENASTLTPDELYVKFYYSHPPATIRISNLEKN